MPKNHKIDPKEGCWEWDKTKLFRIGLQLRRLLMAKVIKF